MQIITEKMYKRAQKKFVPFLKYKKCNSFAWYHQSWGQKRSKNYCHKIEFAYPVMGKWKNHWLKWKWKGHLGSSEAFVQVKNGAGVVIKQLYILTCRNIIFKITSLYPSLTITASLSLSRKIQFSGLSCSGHSALACVNFIFKFCQLKLP